MSNRILIIGATGNNGLATLNALFAKHDSNVTVRAAVRSQQKADELAQRYPTI